MEADRVLSPDPLPVITTRDEEKRRIAGMQIPYWAALPLLLLILPTVEGIICYQCDALGQESPRNTCRGWYRRKPVDTFLDMHDRGGLYTHCIEIRYAHMREREFQLFIQSDIILNVVLYVKTPIFRIEVGKC